MAMVLNKSSNMGSPLLHEFKRRSQMELFGIQIHVPWVLFHGLPFEVDDYRRNADILHKRLVKFDRKNWRVSYKTLLLWEHLLTHGPLRVAEEFQCDKDAIKEMVSFQFVDKKGFNWGSRVRKLSQRILKLLENGLLLKKRKERAGARELTREIQGFGSFFQRSSSADESLKALSFSTWLRCDPNYSHQHNHGKDDEFMDSNEKLLFEERIQNREETSQPAST